MPKFQFHPTRCGDSVPYDPGREFTYEIFQLHPTESGDLITGIRRRLVSRNFNSTPSLTGSGAIKIVFRFERTFCNFNRTPFRTG